MDDDEYAHSPEKELINMKENYEVEYWTKKLGVSREQLQEAVDAVGSSAEEVKKYLM
ncbi:DUF3606 domain-containing protein [Mucilaginibacter sp. X5P1]|uniref:DUF3606 domain-containing protein n=1 Tax=Mucilaginibacter sp. X5P1 TaxID=2723088 RepID=UPI00160E8BAA|nr:DUF3606 domain-containing protein [Mucilaginibacter sp. X5P1]MBB6137867.1 hypothetical protein [Mucilaginibacter sp. X5P1]